MAHNSRPVGTPECFGKFPGASAQSVCTTCSSYPECAEETTESTGLEVRAMKAQWPKDARFPTRDRDAKPPCFGMASYDNDDCRYHCLVMTKCLGSQHACYNTEGRTCFDGGDCNAKDHCTRHHLQRNRGKPEVPECYGEERVFNSEACNEDSCDWGAQCQIRIEDMSEWETLNPAVGSDAYKRKKAGCKADFNDGTIIPSICPINCEGVLAGWCHPDYTDDYDYTCWGDYDDCHKRSPDTCKYLGHCAAYRGDEEDRPSCFGRPDQYDQTCRPAECEHSGQCYDDIQKANQRAYKKKTGFKPGCFGVEWDGHSSGCQACIHIDACGQKYATTTKEEGMEDRTGPARPKGKKKGIRTKMKLAGEIVKLLPFHSVEVGQCFISKNQLRQHPDKEEVFMKVSPTDVPQGVSLSTGKLQQFSKSERVIPGSAQYAFDPEKT